MNPSRMIVINVVVELDPEDKHNQIVVQHGKVPPAFARRLLLAAVDVLDGKAAPLESKPLPDSAPVE